MKAILDEMLAAMYRVGRQLPPDLRETALGGCAATPAGKALGCGACPCHSSAGI